MAFTVLRVLTIISLLSLINATFNDHAHYALEEDGDSSTDPPTTITSTPEPPGLVTSYRPASGSIGAESPKASSGINAAAGVERQPYGTVSPTTVTAPPITVTVTSTVSANIEPLPNITPTVTLTRTITVCAESNKDMNTGGNGGGSDVNTIRGGGNPDDAFTTEEGGSEPSRQPDSGLESVDMIPSPTLNSIPGGSYPEDFEPDSGSQSYQPLGTNTAGYQAPSFPETGDGQFTGNAERPISNMEPPPNTSLFPDARADGNAISSAQPGSGGEETTNDVNSNQDYGEGSGNVVTPEANTANQPPGDLSVGQDQDMQNSQMTPEISASLGAGIPVESGSSGDQIESGIGFTGSSVIPPYGFINNTSSGSGFVTGSDKPVIHTGATSATAMPQPTPSNDHEGQDTSSLAPYTSIIGYLPMETTAISGNEGSGKPFASGSANTGSYHLPPFGNSTTPLPPAEGPYEPATGTGSTSQGSGSLPPTTQPQPYQTSSSNPSDTQQAEMPTTTSGNTLANQTSSDTGVVVTTMTREVIPYPAKPATNSSSDRDVGSLNNNSDSSAISTGGFSVAEEDTGDEVDNFGSTTAGPAENNSHGPLPTTTLTASFAFDDHDITSSTPLESLRPSEPESSSAVEEHDPIPALPQPPLSNPKSNSAEPPCLPSQENRLVKVDFNHLDPSSPLPNPYESISYTGFSVSSASSRLSAFASGVPRTIAVAAPAKHFNLTSISLACSAPPCNISMWGTKVQTKTATGAPAGTLLVSMTRVEGKDEYKPVEGLVEKGWVNLEKIGFSAEGEGGEDVGLGIDDLSYWVGAEGGCEGGGEDAKGKGDGVEMKPEGVEDKSGEVGKGDGGGADKRPEELGKGKRGLRRKRIRKV
ncbi:MAG: hypothetical protein Q9169_000797 [Polycauliona sp. 2 TL-2023]